MRVKVVGMDAWSRDRPLPCLAKDFKDTGNLKVVWETNFAEIEIGYCHMGKPIYRPSANPLVSKYAVSR
jgi:hypothetical protein